ncbi:MAG TPA: SsrA-binding protein SmpB [Acidimicrobiales bacterium]
MPKGPTRRAPGASKIPSDRKVVAQNRRARHDYEILDEVEGGLVLLGSEVKSLREGKCQLRDSYARVDGGEMWLYGVHIPPYLFATGFGAHDPERRRKILLHHREITEFGGRAAREGLTLVPLSVYFRGGKAKVEIALARGRHTYDKRHALAARDAQRDEERAFSGRDR